MKLYDAHIIFRNNKYDPVEIRGYITSDIYGPFIKFVWPGEQAYPKTVVYHMDDIHEISTQDHEE